MKYIIEITTGESPAHILVHHPTYAYRVLKAALPVEEIKSPERILWHKAAPGLRVFKTEEKV